MHNIVNHNHVPNHKPRFEKYGNKFDVRPSIMTRNPSEFDSNYRNHPARTWIWFEEWRYLCKKPGTVEEVIHNLKSAPNREIFLERLTDYV